MRVFAKLLFCVEIKYRCWDSRCCVHKLPVWWAYGTYSTICKLHKTLFLLSLYAASQQKGCVGVTLTFSISPSFTLIIGKSHQCVNGHDTTKRAPGNVEKTAEEWLLRETLWSPPGVPSPGTSGMGDSAPLPLLICSLGIMVLIRITPWECQGRYFRFPLEIFLVPYVKKVSALVSMKLNNLLK